MFFLISDSKNTKQLTVTHFIGSLGRRTEREKEIEQGTRFLYFKSPGQPHIKKKKKAEKWSEELYSLVPPTLIFTARTSDAIYIVVTH